MNIHVFSTYHYPLPIAQYVYARMHARFSHYHAGIKYLLQFIDLCYSESSNGHRLHSAHGIAS